MATTRRSFLKRAAGALAAGTGFVLLRNRGKPARALTPAVSTVTVKIDAEEFRERIEQAADEAYRLRVTVPYGIEMPPISGWHRFDVTLDPTVPDGYTLHIDGVRWTSRQA